MSDEYPGLRFSPARGVLYAQNFHIVPPQAKPRIVPPVPSHRSYPCWFRPPPPYPSHFGSFDTPQSHKLESRCSLFRNWLGGGKSAAAGAAAARAAGGSAGGRGGGGTGAGGAASAGGGAAGAAGDAKLLKLGLESATDRRRVMAVIMKEEENPVFINWFEVHTFGPGLLCLCE